MIEAFRELSFQIEISNFYSIFERQFFANYARRFWLQQLDIFLKTINSNERIKRLKLFCVITSQHIRITNKSTCYYFYKRKEITSFTSLSNLFSMNLRTISKLTIFLTCWQTYHRKITISYVNSNEKKRNSLWRSSLFSTNFDMTSFIKF